MPVTGPTFIALQVRDVAASATFCETRPGLRRTPPGPPGAVVLDTGPAAFAVREPLPGVDLDAVSPRPGTGIAVWLHTDDAPARHGSLVEAGIPVSGDPVDSPFGRTFSFTDPDGYVVTVHDGG